MATPTIWQAVRQGQSSQSDSPSLWQIVADKLDPYSPYPRGVEQVDMAHFKASGGKEYYVLKNRQAGTYVRLDPQGYFLWTLLDGSRSVKDLVVEYFLKYGRLAQDSILELLDHLQTKQFLKQRRCDLYQYLRRKTTHPSWFSRLLQIRFLLFRQALTLQGVDHRLQRLYRQYVRVFFSKPALYLYPVILISGLGVFWQTLQTGQYALIHVGQSYGLGLLVLVLVNAFMVTLHESAHAFTLKHDGLEVPNGGLIFYLGLPCFFVDATDAWMAPKSKRIAVSLAGPYATATLASLMALAIGLFPHLPGNGLLFKAALWGYISALLNLNPLLEFDGYYILVDLLDMPMLRQRSFAFLRNQLPGKILGHEGLNRKQWLYALYGILALLGIGLTLVVSAVVVHWRLEKIWGSLQAGQSWLIRSFLVLSTGVFVLPVALSFLALGAFTTVWILSQLKQHALWQNVTRFIVVTGGLVVGCGLMAIVLVPDSAGPLFWAAGQILGGVFMVCGAFLAWRERRRTWLGGGLLGLGLLGLVAIVSGPLTAGYSPAELRAIFSLPMAQGGRWVMLGLSAIGLVLLAGYRLLNGRFLAIRWFKTRGYQPRPLFDSLLQTGQPYSLIWPVLGIGLVMTMTGSLLVLTRGPYNVFPVVAGMGLPICALGLWGFVLADWHLTSPLSPPLLHGVFRDRERLRSLVDYLGRGLIEAFATTTGPNAALRLIDRFNRRAHRLGLGLSLRPQGFDEGDASTDLLASADRFRTALNILVRLSRKVSGVRITERILIALYDQLTWEDRELLDQFLLPGSVWGSRLRAIQFKGSDNLELIRATALFRDLPAKALEQLARALRPVSYKTGQVIVRQETAGDQFYLIKTGIAEVTRRQEGREQLLAHLYPGDYFGEVALLHDVPRTATVRAVTDMNLLALGRPAFDTLIRGSFELLERIGNGIELLQFLRRIPLFEDFSPHQLSLVMSHFQPLRYAPGITLIRAGDRGDRFYLITRGEVRVFQEKEGHTRHVATLGGGEYFGEIALLKDIPRTATVVTATEVELLALDKPAFDRLIKNQPASGHHLELMASRRLYHLTQALSDTHLATTNPGGSPHELLAL